MQITPELLDYMTEAERGQLEGLLAMLPPWTPDARNKPQCEAYTTEAFETLYGGAAGGGKSDLLLGLARTQHTRSLLLRREFPDLERSLISRSLEFFGDRKAYNASKHVWNVDGRRIEFGHMERIGTANEPKDEEQYASAPYDLIGFDQLEQFTEYGYVFMISRARSTERSQRVRILSSANPVGEGIEWIMRRWAPWLDEAHKNPAKSGEIRWYKRGDDGIEIETTQDDPDAISRTFIAAGLADNPYLDDDYRRSLNLLPEPLRSALLSGNWSAMLTDDAYQVIPRAWVRAAQERWIDKPPLNIPQVIGVDVARGGADQTTFAPRRGNWFGSLIKYPGRQTPDGQSVVGLIMPLMKDDTTANVDVIGVGASTYDIGKLKGLNFRPVNFAAGSHAVDKSGQMSFVNMRAECYWRFREFLEPESYKDLPEAEWPMLPPDPELLGDLCAPRWQMQTNGIKIEDKEKIKERIGRSPDCGDAAVLAKANAISPADLIGFV